MSHPSFVASAWDTSCVGQPADVSLLELSHLSEHLAHCGALTKLRMLRIEGACPGGTPSLFDC